MPAKVNRTMKQPVLRLLVKLIKNRPNRPISSKAGKGMSKADITFFSSNILK
ncbi:hypothetical protein VroAM7_10410 [Vibrio rotiferianus]|jgi:hypothetical protein|uniref:Uncharacterized protein n=1 Tax=Vibrio rotiferianus TaxID=190895 RepID=A0A510I591_9VIBR|nr:hypothetical protein VroAM7_10410 [Vibrio rotiferianus]